VEECERYVRSMTTYHVSKNYECDGGGPLSFVYL